MHHKIAEVSLSLSGTALDFHTIPELIYVLRGKTNLVFVYSNVFCPQQSQCLSHT